MANGYPEASVEADPDLHFHLDLLPRLRIALVVERLHPRRRRQHHQRLEPREPRGSLRGDEQGQQPLDLGQQHHPALRALLHHGSLRPHRQGHSEGQEGFSRQAESGGKFQTILLSKRSRRKSTERLQEQVGEQLEVDVDERNQRMATVDEKSLPDDEE